MTENLGQKGTVVEKGRKRRDQIKGEDMEAEIRKKAEMVEELRGKRGGGGKGKEIGEEKGRE